MGSTSTIESSLPPTPKDEPLELDLQPQSAPVQSKGSVPFPPFEPVSRPLSAKHPLRASMRPGMPSRQHSTGHSRGAGSLQISLPASASTSHLVPSPVDTRPTRPVHMIRKKSGEVVKPSLKQRSMSTPDLTRSVEDSPEASEEGRAFGEERSKSVRFAGTSDGSPLANVVLFLRNQKPAAVSKTADGQPDETETEADTDAEASDFVEFRTRKIDLAKQADDARQIQLEGGSRVPRVRCDFSPDARNALNGEHVVLERAELASNNGSLCLQGTTIVRNVAFQKWVAVRFTLDHWQYVPFPFVMCCGSSADQTEPCPRCPVAMLGMCRLRRPAMKAGIDSASTSSSKTTSESSKSVSSSCVSASRSTGENGGTQTMG